MPKYTLADAVKRHEENPDTFLIPSRSEIRKVREGDCVKVGLEFRERGHVECERIWVKISTVIWPVGGPMFCGAIDNDPLFKAHGLKLGDDVTLDGKHIFEIMK